MSNENSIHHDRNPSQTDSQHSAVRPAVPLGSTRCYWSILDPSLNVIYIDPIFEAHLGPQALKFIGTNLLDYVHPDERKALQHDLIPRSPGELHQSGVEGHGVFGSVTRCRYSRLTRIRRLLGCSEPEVDPEASLVVIDSDWLSVSITTSWIGGDKTAGNTSNGAVLAFFHASQDKHGEQDHDEAYRGAWSNWCGPMIEHGPYLDSFRCAQLEQILADATQTNSNQPTQQNPQSPPAHVFQILDHQGQAIVTCPPRWQGQYDVEEYAALAREVVARPREASEDRTSCTRRYRSKHPILKSGSLRTIESVVILYGAVTFACFQMGGIYLNHAQSQQLNPANSFNLENVPQTTTDSQHNKKSFAAANPPSSRSHHSHPVPPPLSIPSLQHQNLKFPPGDRGNLEGLSPTVATASAILGSFQSHHPQQSSLQTSTTEHLPPISQVVPPFITQQQRNPIFPPVTSQTIQFSQQPQPPATGFYPNFANTQFQMHSMPSAAHSQPSYATTNPSNMFSLPAQPYSPIAPATASTASQFPPSQPNIPQPAPTNVPVQPMKLAEPQQAQPAVASTLSTSPIEVNSNESTSANSNKAPKTEPVNKPGPAACESCGIVNSPEWRKGPTGQKTLCNACGLRFARSQTRKKKLAEMEANGLTPNKKTKKAKKSTNDEKTVTTSTTNSLPAQQQQQQSVRSPVFDNPAGVSPTFPSGNNHLPSPTVQSNPYANFGPSAGNRPSPPLSDSSYTPYYPQQQHPLPQTAAYPSNPHHSPHSGSLSPALSNHGQILPPPPPQQQHANQHSPYALPPPLQINTNPQQMYSQHQHQHQNGFAGGYDPNYQHPQQQQPLSATTSAHGNPQQSPHERNGPSSWSQQQPQYPPQHLQQQHWQQHTQNHVSTGLNQILTSENAQQPQNS